MIFKPVALLIALATLAASGAAQAQTAPVMAAAAPAPTIRLTASQPPALKAPQQTALEAAVLNKTAVEHRFADDGLVASAGFLCGRGPSLDNDGAAAATGYDPQGRFIGAKVSFAFR